MASLFHLNYHHTNAEVRFSHPTGHRHLQSLLSSHGSTKAGVLLLSSKLIQGLVERFCWYDKGCVIELLFLNRHK